MLTAQLNEWESFRACQIETRRHYVGRGRFHVLIDRMRDCRRRHGLDDQVYLSPDWKQQSRLQNWIEFQNYHLERHAEKELDLKKEMECLDAMRQERGPKGSFTREEVIGISEYRVGYSKRVLENYGKMLRWIEQQRKAMVAEQAEDEHKSPRNRSPPTLCGRRKKVQASHSQLSPIQPAISKKSTPKQKYPPPFSKHKKTLQQSFSTSSGVTKTRSGREVKRPRRLGFETAG